MPNWNTTDVVVTGPAEQIDKLYDVMTSLENSEKERIENGFGKTWYGCLVDALGGDYHSTYCRGSWQCLEKVNNTTIKWFDETAWGPLLDVFELIEEQIPEIKIYWLAEEPGMVLYASNDTEHLFFDVRYILYYDDYETEYFDSKEELIEFVNKCIEGNPELKVDKPITTIDELNAFIEDTDGFAYYPYTYESN